MECNDEEMSSQAEQMVTPVNLDLLNLAEDDDVVKQFQNPSAEAIMMSVKVSKWNKYFLKQERNLIVSNVNIYNFNKKKLKRIIAIADLNGMTKNI